LPRRNRVTPLGELIATPERGLVYGNRGCLHDEQETIRRAYSTKRWIACQLQFRGRRRKRLMAPGRFTELFFLDEVTALAAGHRPCAECRRADYNRLVDVWSALHPDQHGADAIDAQLHDERLVGRGGGRPGRGGGRPGRGGGRPGRGGGRPGRGRERRLHSLAYGELPDGAFVLHDDAPALVLGGALLTWSPGGYVDRRRRPRNADATVITPPSLLELLRSGWTPLVPLLHPSATA
jgi:hypothetical protein